VDKVRVRRGKVRGVSHEKEVTEKKEISSNGGKKKTPESRSESTARFLGKKPQGKKWGLAKGRKEEKLIRAQEIPKERSVQIP